MGNIIAKTASEKGMIVSWNWERVFYAKVNVMHVSPKFDLAI